MCLQYNVLAVSRQYLFHWNSKARILLIQCPLPFQSFPESDLSTRLPPKKRFIADYWPNFSRQSDTVFLLLWRPLAESNPYKYIFRRRRTTFSFWTRKIRTDFLVSSHNHFLQVTWFGPCYYIPLMRFLPKRVLDAINEMRNALRWWLNYIMPIYKKLYSVLAHRTAYKLFSLTTSELACCPKLDILTGFWSICCWISTLSVMG